MVNNIKTEKEILSETDYCVLKDELVYTRLGFSGQFGAIESIELRFGNISTYVKHKHKDIKQIIEALAEVLDIEKKDNLNIGDLRNIHCKIVTDSKQENKVYGIGSAENDKFILFETLV
ncbi:MAG: hypothetical protein GX078_07390 [Clostridiales bacterium]|nr:hypothetical protein [Clostridiales bacterium]